MQDTLYEMDYQDVAGAISDKLLEVDEQLSLQERLNNLKVFTDGLTQPSLETVKAIQLGVDLAFAGSSYDHRDVDVTLEDSSLTISTEGISTALEALKRATKAAIDAIIEFFKRAYEVLTTNVGRLEFRLTRVKSVAKSMRGKTLNKPVKIPVTAGQNYLKLQGKVVSGGAQISLSLDQMRIQLNAVLGDYVPVVASMGKNMQAIIAGNDDPDTKVAKLNQEGLRLPVAQLASKISARSQVDTRYSLNRPVLVGPAMLGDKSIYCYSFAPSTSLLEAAQEIRTFKVSFDANKNNRPVTGEIDVLSVDVIVAITEKIDAIIKIIRQHEADGAGKALEGLRKVIDRAVAQLDQSTATRAQNEAILRYSTTYAGWVSSPRVALLQHAVLCCESLLTLCSRSLAHYRD